MRNIKKTDLKYRLCKLCRKSEVSFMIILLVLVIISSFTLIITVNNFMKNTRDIGEAASTIIKASQEGEQINTYIDFASKFGVRDAEYELASKGGMITSECGNYMGVNLWYSNGQLCLPKAYKEDFKTIFKQKLASYLSGFYGLGVQKFEIKVLPGKVIGLAEKEVSVVGSLVEVPEELKFKKDYVVQLQGASGQAGIQSGEGVTIIFGGDATTLDKQTNPFENIMAFVNNNLFFINLETIITTQEYTQAMIAANSQQKYHMRVLPEHAEYLSTAGVDMANVANNHADDFGAPGLSSTMNFLESNSIAFCGASKAAGQRTYTIITSSNGIKIGFVCYTEYVNSGTLHGLEHANDLVWIFNDNIKQDIVDARSSGAQIVIASIHAGTTDIVADSFQTNAARKAIEYGADMVIGHGAHKVQGIEFIQKDGKLKPIVYGLGNLIGGRGIENPDVAKLGTSGEASKAILFQVTFDKNADVIAYKVIPLIIPSTGIPEPAQGQQATDIKDDAIARSSGYAIPYKQDLETQITSSGADINLQCSIPQFTSNSESIGSSSDGKLENPAMLQSDLPYYNVEKAFTRNRMYGTNELITMIENSACISYKSTGVKVKVNDLSSASGGDVDGHVSHESGRDVDFGLYIKKDNALYNQFEDVSGSSIKNFDFNANLLLLKAIAASGDIKMILLDQQIIDALKAFAQSNGADQSTMLALSKLHHYPRHENHYHIRINCAQDDTQCTG